MRFALPITAFAALALLAAANPQGAPQQDPSQQQPNGNENRREERRAQRQERREPRQLGGEAEGEQRGDTGESEEVDEATDAKPQKGDYKSPYSLKFKYPIEQLLFDRHSERGSVAFQSSTPEREWYSEAVRKKSGGWGVEPRRFDCPPEVREKPADWKRERIIAGASRFIGYDYQHHHIPDWDPPKDWKWNKCCAGHQSKGVDCSNFSGWNYNWGLGIHLNTAIRTQAQQASVKGERGQSPDGTPLIMDSTGGKIKDCEGHAIPCGIHLRPFKKGSWYHKSFSHAHRWVE